MQYLRDLLVRLNNKRKKQQLAKTPFFSDTTLKSDVQWLEPLFFGTETLKSMIFSTKNIEESRKYGKNPYEGLLRLLHSTIMVVLD